MAFRSVSKQIAEGIWSTAEKAIQATRDPLHAARAEEKRRAARLAAGRCPLCGEPLRFLAPEAAFCLQCDWDNLPLLNRNRRR